MRLWKSLPSHMRLLRQLRVRWRCQLYEYAWRSAEAFSVITVTVNTLRFFHSSCAQCSRDMCSPC